MDIGKAILKFVGDTSDVEKKTSSLNNILKNVAGGITKSITGITTVAATTLIGVTKKAVASQGELEQQIGGTEAVFGQYAKTIQNDAANAFDKMGVSANDYMATMNKMGSLMQGSGIDTKKSMELTSQAMQRAADVASVMGISTEDAMKAVTGAAKGNFTMMDNLGVSMNATSLSAYALEKGLGKTYAQMSQGEKVELAMQMFMEKTAKSAGNYAKENKTFAGSLNTVKAAAQNLLSGAGTVDQMITALKSFADVLTQNLVTILPQVVQGIVELVNGIIPYVPQIVMAVLPAFIQGVTQLTIGIIEMLPEIANMIADMLPTLIPQVMEAIMLLIPAILKAIPQFVSAGLTLMGKMMLGIWNGIMNINRKIGQKILGIAKAIYQNSPFLKAGVELIKGLWKGISNSYDWLKNKIKSWVGMY